MKKSKFIIIIISILVLIITVVQFKKYFFIKQTISIGKINKVIKRELAPNIVYTYYEARINKKPQKIHTVTFDPKDEQVVLKPYKYNNQVYGRYKLSNTAKQVINNSDSKVIAGINADYFHMGNGIPIGLFLKDRRILSTPGLDDEWYAFGFTNEKESMYGLMPKVRKDLITKDKTVEISHINRLHHTDDSLILFSKDFYDNTLSDDSVDEYICEIISGDIKLQSAMKLKVVDIKKGHGEIILSAKGKYKDILNKISINDIVSTYFDIDQDWSSINFLVGGRYLLVKDGESIVHDDNLTCARSAIGTLNDGRIIMLVVDGDYSEYSVGVSLEEFSTILKDFGCINAINLDGEGSSTLVINNQEKLKVINKPSDSNGERKVANALILTIE